jgi:hypothetical protein
VRIGLADCAFYEFEEGRIVGVRTKKELIFSAVF